MTKNLVFPTIFKEVFEPRTVNHCLSCNFVHNVYKSLVLIGSTNLHIYNLVHNQHEPKFDHFHSINFNQEVLDAVYVKYYGNSLDSIILAFEDAKVSVISFDPLSHEVKTISLHFYEFETLKKTRTDYRKYSILRVDPEQRCAVLQIYDDILGVIPFRKSPNLISSSLEGNFNRQKSSKMIPSVMPIENVTQHDLFSSQGLMTIDRPAPNLPTYVTNITNLPGVKIGAIEDMRFLHGYYEPTLMILYDPMGTFSGQSLLRKDPMCMITLSLNLQKRTNPIIWHLQNLPYECFKLVPVPRPIGGIVILSSNIIIYLNQSQPSCGFALNGYAKKTTNFPLRHINLLRPLCIDNCVCQFITSEQMIIISKTGELFVASLMLEPVMRTVVGIRIEKNFKTVAPTCLNILSSNYLFVGSHVTNSVLLRYEPKNGVGDLYVTSDTPEDIMMKIPENDERVVNNNHYCIKSYNFMQVDYIKNIGPIRSVSLAENHGYSYTNLHDPHHMRLTNELTFVELMATTGNGEFGCVSLINFSVKPKLFSLFEISYDMTNMWWVHGGSPQITDESNMDQDQVDSVAADTDAEVEAAMSTDVNDVQMENEREAVARAEAGILNEANVEANKKMLEDIDDDNLKDFTGEIVEERRDYIILSGQNGTMILEITKNIVEIERSGFRTDIPTVATGNIGSIYCANTNNTYPLIYQVLSNSIRLLNGSHLLEEQSVDTEHAIIQTSSCLNYIILRTVEHELFLVTVPKNSINSKELNSSQENSRKLLKIDKIDFESRGPICSICMFDDEAGFLYKGLYPSEEDVEMTEEEEDDLKAGHPYFSDNILDDLDAALYANSKNSVVLPKSEPVVIDTDIIPEEMDNVERFLYGEKSLDEPVVQSQQPIDIIVNPDDQLFNPELQTDKNNTQGWAFILFTDGTLEIYNVPEFKLHFRTDNFFDTPNLLLNCWKYPHLAHLQASYKNFQQPTNTDQKFEILVCNIGRNKNRPILLARGQEELIIYEMLQPISKGLRYMKDIGDHLRFRKMPIPILMRPIKKAKEDVRLNDLHRFNSTRNSSMVPFENINGFRGVFVAGSYPMWLFFTQDGNIVPLPMYMEGVVPCFASNPNPVESDPSFSYFNARGELKMMILPQGYDFEYQKPVKRIAFKKNVLFVQYHIESKIFAVISTVEKEIKTLFKLNAENCKEEEPMNRDRDILHATVSHYVLEFYANHTNGGWEIVPHARIVFEDWDKVTCMNTVQLNPHSTYAGTKDFLAIGSNMIYGEEIPVRGKILIVDVVNVVPQPGKPLTQHKIKPIYDQEQKGAVTALASCRGLLVSAVGQKLYVWQLRDGDLVGIAFVDTDVYVIQLQCVRDVLLAADIDKAIQLVRFQSELRVLSLSARGPPPCCRGGISAYHTQAANFMVSGNNLGLVSFDAERNISILIYDPIDSNSNNGRQLVRIADGRLPTIMHCSVRINDRIRDPLLYTPSTLPIPQDLLRQSIYTGSATGSIYRISPISTEQLIQMKLTEKNLSQTVHHYGGLHPKSCSTYKFVRPMLANSVDNMADGNLLYKYITLPHSQKVEVAIKAGVDMNRILENLTDVLSSTLHF